MQRIRVSLGRLPTQDFDEHQHRALDLYATRLHKIQHENIAMFMGGGRDTHGRPFFVWYQYHCNLRVGLQYFRQKNTPMSWYTRLNVAQDIARGLKYAEPMLRFF